MRRLNLMLTLSACLLAGLLAAGTVLFAQSRQTGSAPLPSLSGQPIGGRDSFQAYCASCHGRGGAGDGPVAASLKTRPADLTGLARRNGGIFPAERVEAYVTGTGRSLAAHGTTEMPIWGSTFRAFETDARVKERIRNLVSYIQSLQPATSGSSDPGAVLFQTHCAACHGADGRGNGPMAGQLRRTPPDLTNYAARNGGVFPSEKLSRIVDGRDVMAHGDSDMPVWGTVFKRTGRGDDADVAARIAAIVRYVGAIQRRAAE